MATITTSTTATPRPPEPVRRGSQRNDGAKLAACLVFAVLSLGNGIDRQAASSPQLAAKVPALFADQALIARGEAALNSGHLIAAYEDGVDAVRRSPVDPSSSALLASARLGLNDPEGAQRAFRVAGQMGWRVPLTQAYWMQQAIAADNLTVAATRMDALLRQHPWVLSQPGILAPLENNPAGRAAIASRLMAAPTWLSSYAFNVEGLSAEVITQRAQVLGLLAARGLRVGCDMAAPPTNRLVDTGRIAEAQALWRSQCLEAGTAIPADPEFAYLRIGGARTYFEWDLLGSADVGVVIVPGSKARAQQLEIHNGSPFTRQVLHQLIVPSPGRYRLSWLAATTDGKASNQALVELGCRQGPVQRLVPIASGSLWHADVVIGGDCPAHMLTVSVLPGSGDLRLGSIRLDPAD